MAQFLLLPVPVLPWVDWDLLMMNLDCVSCVPVPDRACVLVSDLFDRACVLAVDPPMLRVDCLIETNSLLLVQILCLGLRHPLPMHILYITH